MARSVDQEQLDRMTWGRETARPLLILWCQLAPARHGKGGGPWVVRRGAQEFQIDADTKRAKSITQMALG